MVTTMNVGYLLLVQVQNQQLVILTSKRTEFPFFFWIHRKKKGNHLPFLLFAFFIINRIINKTNTIILIILITFPNILYSIALYCVHFPLLYLIAKKTIRTIQSIYIAILVPITPSPMTVPNI